MYELGPLVEAVCGLAAQAAERMQKQNSLAAVLLVFVRAHLNSSPWAAVYAQCSCAFMQTHK
jgi:hypothetical protein